MQQAFTVLEPTAKAFPRDTATQVALADCIKTLVARPMPRGPATVHPGGPSNAQVLNHLGYMLAESGQLDEAVRLVQRALDIDPGNPFYLDSLVGAFAAAISRRKSIIPRRRSRRAALKCRTISATYRKRGRWQDAITAWTRCSKARAKRSIGAASKRRSPR